MLKCHDSHKKRFCLNTFFLICIAIYLCACVKSTPQIPDSALQNHAQIALDNFVNSLNMQEAKQTQAYSLTGSIRFSTNDKSSRATYLIWSNGAHPVRFDLQAGIGASVAKIMETEENIIFYFPLEKKAVVTLPQSALNNLLSLDTPIPLTFLDLSYLCRGILSAYLAPFVKKEKGISLGNRVAEHLVFSQKHSKNGQFAFDWHKDAQKISISEIQEQEQNTEILTENPEEQTPEEQNSEEQNSDEQEETPLNTELLEFQDYLLGNTPFFTRIILDENGLATEYIIQNDWHIYIQYIEKDPKNTPQKIPYKITIQSLENDTNIILLVKENNDTVFYTEEHLNLILPENTTMETYHF